LPTRPGCICPRSWLPRYSRNRIELHTGSGCLCPATKRDLYRARRMLNHLSIFIADLVLSTSTTSPPRTWRQEALWPGDCLLQSSGVEWKFEAFGVFGVGFVLPHMEEVFRHAAPLRRRRDRQAKNPFRDNAKKRGVNHDSKMYEHSLLDKPRQPTLAHRARPSRLELQMRRPSPSSHGTIAVFPD
jgi:hypothetical protein